MSSKQAVIDAKAVFMALSLHGGARHFLFSSILLSCLPEYGDYNDDGIKRGRVWTGCDFLLP